MKRHLYETKVKKKKELIAQLRYGWQAVTCIEGTCPRESCLTAEVRDKHSWYRQGGPQAALGWGSWARGRGWGPGEAGQGHPGLCRCAWGHHRVSLANRFRGWPVPSDRYHTLLMPHKGSERKPLSLYSGYSRCHLPEELQDLLEGTWAPQEGGTQGGSAGSGCEEPGVSIRPRHSASGNPTHRFLGSAARVLSALIGLNGPD